MKVFQGMRSSDGVLVTLDGVDFGPELSLKIRNHSPCGFEWGYGGSGPAQMALAILLEFLPVGQAERLYQRFKAEVVASLNKDGWLLRGDEVKAWIARNRFRLTDSYVELPELPDEVLDVVEGDEALRAEFQEPLKANAATYIFNLVYEALATIGACDTPGGMEYARVRREWEQAGRPPSVGNFILAQANIDAQGRQEFELMVTRVKKQ